MFLLQEKLQFLSAKGRVVALVPLSPSVLDLDDDVTVLESTSSGGRAGLNAGYKNAAVGRYAAVVFVSAAYGRGEDADAAALVECRAHLALLTYYELGSAECDYGYGGYRSSPLSVLKYRLSCVY